MRLFILLVTISCSIFACKSEVNTPATEEGIEEIASNEQISDIIRNPVSAEGNDTVNVAKIVFEETEHIFGEIDEGAVVKHTFKFKNTGKIPLVISGARSTCGCTIPEWPKEPIPAGEEGEIDVVFKSEGKKEGIRKPVTISANTFPGNTVIYMKGYVHPKGK